MSRGYTVAHIDELERLPVDEEGLTWRPVRRRLGIEAFGVNAYTAEQPGQRVVEEHREAQNEHEELYLVASGRATFTVEDDEVDAPAGTFVFVQPGTLRGAVAADADTTVVAIGGKRGEAFRPSGWEWTFVATSYQRQGRLEEARAVMREGIERYPDAWQGYYNLACIETRAGRREEALAALERAAELDRAGVATYAAEDEDLDAIRDDPRFPA
ncbi:MAG: tetratricopeptide repeat protein [Thermoleophilia bacterium]|nr:tetratricopeptide repeat protein [Thermoleophilia bacterium]